LRLILCTAGDDKAIFTQGETEALCENQAR
jgi:hypothetical protein